MNGPIVDIHCHILPQLDDGPQSMDEATNLAQCFVGDGITHVVATPHCHRYVHLLRPVILPAVKAFNDRLMELRIPLTVSPGSEIQVTDTVEYRREFEAGLLCHINDGRDFTLLEFNWDREQLPKDAIELIRWLRDQQVTPILAHPERHEFFWDDSPLLDQLTDAGAWMQITVDSLLGNHGPKPKDYGQRFMSKYSNVLLATDSHNAKRCSGLSPGFEWVRQRLGNERVIELQDRARQVVKLTAIAD